MGKACLILAAMMLTLAFYPRNEVNGASLENPGIKDRTAGLDRINMMGVDGPNRDEDYEYDFMNQPRFGGGYPRGLRAMQRQERLMKRLRRHAMEDSDQPSFLE